MKLAKLVATIGTCIALAACTHAGRGVSGSSYGSVDTVGGDNGEMTSQGLADGSGFAGSSMSQEELLKIHTYYFAYDSATVSDETKPAVIAEGQYLASHPDEHILLAGNTDNRGSREYNIALGWRRAKSVADLMMLNGASEDQIRMVSYGEEKPVEMGNSEAAYEKNRRVDLTEE